MTGIEIRHFHLFCGLGGAALGFNRGEARVGSLRARFRCIGGVDSDPAAVRDFGRLAGVSGTVLDLFDREQYILWHGKEPGPYWRPVTPADVRRAADNERPHIVMTSPPCKGFSALLSTAKSETPRYQALMGLTVRGIWLALEAWADDPPEFFILENVPRIATRGAHLLDQIETLLGAYGYASARTTHDCGELAGLSQSRKRFLLVARHRAKVPPFLYEPGHRPLRGIGDTIGLLPIPGTAGGSPMHQLPALQWKTWVRLAFVPAGGDWRALQNLAVGADGNLSEYLIVPDMYRCSYGVTGWDAPSGTITGDARPSKGGFAVADPRGEALRNASHGVLSWDAASGTVTGEAFPSNGCFAVADPRRAADRAAYGQYGVQGWDAVSQTVTGQAAVGAGRFAVADPRFPAHPGRHLTQARVLDWAGPATTVTGCDHVSGGAQAVADPRLPANPARHSGKYRIIDWQEAATTVTGADGVPTGAQAVADPRLAEQPGRHLAKYRIIKWKDAATTVTGTDRIGSGAQSVADPRVKISGVNGFLNAGHYGVMPWGASCGAVIGSAGCDNGRWNVADPRLPGGSENVRALILALDGTWHRPLTTLELAALQGLVDPEALLELEGASHSAWRERIGNAVPPPAAAAIASMMGETLLMAWGGVSLALSKTPIWVRDLAIGIAVDLPAGGALWTAH